jgi:hypothetical protein
MDEDSERSVRDAAAAAAALAKAGPTVREARLAAALRNNLRRRKRAASTPQNAPLAPRSDED